MSSLSYLSCGDYIVIMVVVVVVESSWGQTAQRRMFQGRNREQRDLVHDEHHPGELPSLIYVGYFFPQPSIANT